MTNETEQTATYEEVEVEDESSAEEDPSNVLPIFEITSYGADYPVDALVRRLESGDITVPQWQRNFVWSRRQCNRFIESLLLGLPVPGIFLYQDVHTGELVVLDGQQRLRTLLAFYKNDLEGRPFMLPQYDPSKYQSIHPDFAGKRYTQLPADSRRRLDNSIVHATIVRQDSPSGPDEASSIYHIFERINSTGTRLSAQEIRAAVFRGALDDLLQELNADDSWRNVFGRPSQRLRDQELILRYIAMLTKQDEYSRPMQEFLNLFMAEHRELQELDAEEISSLFRRSIALLGESVGERVFRPVVGFNAAVFEAVMVGVSRRIQKGDVHDKKGVNQAYLDLLDDDAFLDAYQRATADDTSVRARLQLASAAFGSIA